MDLSDIIDLSKFEVERDPVPQLFDDLIEKWGSRLEYFPKEAPVSWLIPRIIEDVETRIKNNVVHTPYGDVYGTPEALSYVKELVDYDTDLTHIE